MGLSSGPNSATLGLVFTYDTGDTVNSYLGEPTTNIAADLGLVPVILDPITYVGIEDGWKKYSLGGTWSSGTYPYAMALTPVTFTGGLPYCVRATVKTNVPSKFNYFGTSGISYVNQPKDYEGTLSSTLNPDGSYTVTRYNFAYTNTTGQAGYLFTNPVNGATFNPTTDFVWVKEYQAEQKNHPTQYTPTSRSATQGLLPLTGSSINLTDVSFNSSAQMVFDGTNDYINTDFTSGYEGSVELIIECSSYNGAVPFSLDSDNYSSGPNIYFSGGLINWNTGDSQDNAFSNSSYPDSDYHHLVVTNQSSGAALYIDGVLIGTAAGRNMTTTGSNKLWLGRFHGGGYYLNGELPVVRLYSRPLNASEVKENYKGYKTRFNLA